MPLLKRNGKFLKVGEKFADETCVSQCCCDVEGSACEDFYALLALCPFPRSDGYDDSWHAIEGVFPVNSGLRAGAMRVDLNGFAGEITTGASNDAFLFELDSPISICLGGATWVSAPSQELDTVHVNSTSLNVLEQMTLVVLDDDTMGGATSVPVDAAVLTVKAIVQARSVRNTGGQDIVGGPTMQVLFQLDILYEDLQEVTRAATVRWATRLLVEPSLILTDAPFVSSPPTSGWGWHETFLGSSGWVETSDDAVGQHVCTSLLRQRSMVMESVDSTVLMGGATSGNITWTSAPDFGVHVEMTVFETDVQSGWVGNLGGSQPPGGSGGAWVSTSEVFGPFDNTGARCGLLLTQDRTTRLHLGFSFAYPLPANAEILSVFVTIRFRGDRQGHSQLQQFVLREFKLNENVNGAGDKSIGVDVSAAELVAWDDTFAEGELEFGGLVSEWGLTSTDFVPLISMINQSRFGVQFWFDMEPGYMSLSVGESTTVHVDGAKMRIVYKDPALAGLPTLVAEGCCG